MAGFSDVQLPEGSRTEMKYSQRVFQPYSSLQLVLTRAPACLGQ